MWPTSNIGQLESKYNQTGVIVNRKLDFKWVKLTLIGDQSKFCLTKQITEHYLFVYFLLLKELRNQKVLLLEQDSYFKSNTYNVLKK